MPFSMSGNSNWSYNRFDAYEAQYKKETLEEGSCGSKGYQEGGEVKCDKCEGKGCDHCDDKGTHKKSAKKGAKPDYLDFDKDGNKEEPMKKALKDKKEVKEENLEENRMAAYDPEGYARKQAAERDAAKLPKMRNSVAKAPERTDKERRQDRRILAKYYGEGGKKDAIERAKKERDAKREARRMRKEELESTGLFTVEEIELLADFETEEMIEIFEDSRRMSNKQHTARVKANIKSFGDNYTPPKNFVAGAGKDGKGEVLTPKQIEKQRRKSLRKEELEATGAFTAEEIEALLGKS